MHGSRALIACAVLLTPLLLASCQSSVQSVSRPRAKLTIYKIPSPASNPFGLTVGPDGEIWFADRGANKIGRVTTAGQFTEYSVPTSNSAPDGITTGPDGNLWFTENKSGKVARITPSGVVTEFNLDAVNPYPTGIVAGPDGNLWLAADTTTFARLTLSGKSIVRPLPSSNAIAEGTGCITVGADGNLWLSASSEVAKITTSGVITEYPFSGGGDLAGVASGKDGLWFAEMNGSPAIVEATLSGTFKELAIPLDGIPQAFPLAVAVAPDGNVWFTMDSFGQFVGEVTPSGSFTEWMFSDTPGTGFFNSDPGGITVARDGTVWFTVGNDIVKVVPT